VTRNLDILIDKNKYPVPETEKSNLSERPLGIGV
jgi:ribonucleotide reductase alpha subunit